MSYMEINKARLLRACDSYIKEANNVKKELKSDEYIEIAKLKALCSIGGYDIVYLTKDDAYILRNYLLM